MLILSAVEFEEQTIKNIMPEVELMHFSGRFKGIPEEAAEKASILFSYNIISRAGSLDMFPSLKWIQLMSAGYDGINLEDFNKRKIIVSNAHGVYGIPIAEDVMSKLLMFTRKQHLFLRNMSKKYWDKRNDFIELLGKKMLILGTGDIGSEVAKRAKAFGLYVTGYNKSGTKKPFFDQIINDRKILDKTLNGFDFIVVTIPLSDDTFHFVDKQFIGALKQGVIFINISRGAVIDQTELILALKENRIAAAGLDVFEKEPLGPESELWDMDNVIITPHVSGFSDGYKERLKELFLYNLKQFPDTGKMKYVISRRDNE